MRLLQFIDGSLYDKQAAVNAVVADLLDAEGKVNRARVFSVTETHVDSIMQIAGMTDLTNKAELWDIIRDLQALQQAEANYKSGIESSSLFSVLKIPADKVAQANAEAGAGCPLYASDGYPNTVCLQQLPENRQQAV